MKIIFMALVLISLSALANDRAQREALDKIYVSDRFRIFYTLNGEHALPAENRIDVNDNAVPDYIERIALNLKIADILYHKTFGFIDPLKNDRYRGKVNFVDIHIMTTPNFKGVTGDKIIQYHYKNIHDKGNSSIDIKMSNRLDQDTLTPVHELFHVYQNSYALYKNKWYKEGLARWAEYAFETGVGSDKALPATEADLEKLMLKSYGAKYFWNRLALLCDSNKGVFEAPPEIEAMDTIHLVRDHTLHGYEFVRHLLENLKVSSLKRSQDKGYAPYDWKGKQKEDDNNRYILCAIRKTLSSQCEAGEKNPEIQNFIQLMDRYTEQSCGSIF